jgi:quercetin dioxygenase-like cupin family protein
MAVAGPVQEQALWFLDELLRVRVRGAETGGSLSAVEIVAPRGPASPLHVQPREEETFYVLEGELTFHLGGEERAAGEGDVVVIPRGTPHAYRVDSPTARVLVLNSPAGHERFFEAMGRPAERDALPPAPAGPPDLARMAAAAADAGFEILGPPPFAP